MNEILLDKIERLLPSEIEKRSFEIIGEELNNKGIVLDKEKESVIKRAIHTSADFDYAFTLKFSAYTALWRMRMWPKRQKKKA